MLVIAMALLLGLMGWLVGGSQLAIVLIAAIIALFFVSPMMTPVFFWKINSGQRLSPDEAPQLFGILQKLSQRAGLNRLPVLFYLPTDAMLAFTVGQRHNAAIAVSEGLVRGLSRQELAAVLAHEVSHIRHNDTRMTAFAAMAGQVTGMLSVFGQFTLLLSLPLFLAGKVLFSWTAILLLVFSPTLSSLLQLALSRTREYNADLSAAELMGNPEPLASALAKIDRVQTRIYSRLTWPMVPRMPQASWLRTHPPTDERIRRLLAYRDHKQVVRRDPCNGGGVWNRRYCGQVAGRSGFNLIS